MLEKLKNNFQDNDMVFRNINIDNQDITIIYIETLINNNTINQIILKRNIDLKENNLIKINTYQDIVAKLFNGFIVFYLGDNEIYCIEERANLDRGINTVEREISIKGPKDSLTENYNKNLGLIRNRIKSNKLTTKDHIIGKITNTKVSILYIKDIADNNLINNIDKKLNEINIDGIVDSSYLKRYLTNKKTIFPIIEETERPDIIAMNLLEGKIVIITDNSPYALILPSFFIDYFHTPDDYYSKSFNTTFIRIIRLLAFLTSIFIPSYYIAITTINHDAVSTDLLINFLNQRMSVKYPAIVEALLMSITFEILRESDIRMSSTLGTAVSILGGLVLGDALVNAGIISPIMIIVIAISAIAGLAFPSVEITNSIRTLRFIFMILAAVLGIYGLFIGTLLLIINLCDINIFNIPYLYPFTPLNMNEQKDALFKISDNKKKKRNILLTKNINRGR